MDMLYRLFGVGGCVIDLGMFLGGVNDCVSMNLVVLEGLSCTYGYLFAWWIR